MLNLTGKNIVLGITGGIAAYKAIILLRQLKAAGAEVQVVITDAAQAFVTPLTLQVLSNHPVHNNLFTPQAQSGIDHIELANWANILLIAPASADFIARIANGLANDLLATLCLATTAPIILAPAMNQNMWLHPATQSNIQILKIRQVQILEPEMGIQACGTVGPGRMLEPEAIMAALASNVTKNTTQDTNRLYSNLDSNLDNLNSNLDNLRPEQSLTNTKVLMTAGPTREPIDPIRYISNRSSGRMGYSLAQALEELGAQVSLISGPCALSVPLSVERLWVETALDMEQAVQTRISDCQIFIATAAVADYRVANPSVQKIKKSLQSSEDTLTLNLIKNPDILAQVASRPNPPFTVGFAAETQDVEAYAKAKLDSKKLSMIAANLVGAGQGFEVTENALLVLWPGGQRNLVKQPKLSLARNLARLIAERYHAQIKS